LSQGTGTITNDDAAPPTPTLSIDDLNIAEGNSDSAGATFSVTLTPASAQIVKVDFATASGTATTVDYQLTTGTLTFTPGETSKLITVIINGDTLVEPDETFFVNLANATGGAAIGKSQGLGTIQNDDTANLVISQLYGGGGNSGATFQNDFVELFNRGTTTVDFALTPYSVQYASSSGNNWLFVRTRSTLFSARTTGAGCTPS
jgi:ethanolamine utilization microcompartment shell protein EutS